RDSLRISQPKKSRVHPSWENRDRYLARCVPAKLPKHPAFPGAADHSGPPEPQKACEPFQAPTRHPQSKRGLPTRPTLRRKVTAVAWCERTESRIGVMSGPVDSILHSSPNLRLPEESPETWSKRFDKK